MKSPAYPIGTYQLPKLIDQDVLHDSIQSIERLPNVVTQLVSSLSAKELQLTYRSEGWTISQVVHHLADSHMNAYIRTKLTLTEGTPTIKPYDEQSWTLFHDASPGDIGPSLFILEGLHQRWVDCLSNCIANDFNKKFFHPEHQLYTSLGEALTYYGWHCKHHEAHIRQALQLR